MNNVEALEDFIHILKETFPNIRLDKRDGMLLGMAINHAYLLKRDEIDELKSRMFKLEGELVSLLP